MCKRASFIFCVVVSDVCTDCIKVKTDLDNECWTLSSEKCIKTAVANVEEKLAKSNQKLPTKCMTPFASGHHPSEDTLNESNAEGLNCHQEPMGTLRWAMELGGVDILLEVALLSSHLALPRAGHPQQVCHVFGHLKNSPRRRLFFDPAHPKTLES